MVRRFRWLILMAALACAGEPGVTDPASSPPPPPPPSPIADVLLRDIVIPTLPSPYYRFEYDSSGRVTFAAFASDLRTYDIRYEGNRMVEMHSTRFTSEQLAYFYDGVGKPTLVTYTDQAGVVYVRVHLAYSGNRLIRLERERLVDGTFQFDKLLSFVYDTSGNLEALSDERLAVAGQTESTVVDRFEDYDAGINVDGFSLVHSEFFDHLVLLPGIRLQRGNPRRVTRSGSGQNYRIDYTYTYDRENRPLTKHGEGILLNGADAGTRFQTNATFEYD